MKGAVLRTIAFVLIFCLMAEQPGFCQSIVQLPFFQSSSSTTFNLDNADNIHLRYLAYEPAQTSFVSLLDTGGNKDMHPNNFRATLSKLMEYFFIGVSLPNSAFWVNLRPDGENDIIDDELAKTDVGKILLEADLALKKDVTQATSPATVAGKKYWESLYRKATELWGMDKPDICTMMRPWIVPGEIIIRETAGSLYIYKATLKVMLEQDYLRNSTAYKFDDPRSKELNDYSAQLLRTLIIPEITRRVNTDTRYSALRQVYYSLILAQWFKKQYGRSPSIQQVAYREDTIRQRIDSGNLETLTSKIRWSKKTYFDGYKKSFSKGEYDLQETRSSFDTATVRRYVSGGLNLCAILSAAGDKVIPGNPFKGPVVGAGLIRSAITVASDGGEGLRMSVTATGDTVETRAEATVRSNHTVPLRDGGLLASVKAFAYDLAETISMVFFTIIGLPLFIIVTGAVKQENYDRVLDTMITSWLGPFAIFTKKAPAHHTQSLTPHIAPVIDGERTAREAMDEFVALAHADHGSCRLSGDCTITFVRWDKDRAEFTVNGGTPLVTLAVAAEGYKLTLHDPTRTALRNGASKKLVQDLERLLGIEVSFSGANGNGEEEIPQQTPDVLLQLWEKELELATLGDSGDSEQAMRLFKSKRLPRIITFAKLLINYSFLSKEMLSKKDKNDEAFKITEQLIRLSLRTADMLHEEWRANGLSGEDKEHIAYGLRYLLDTARYSLELWHALQLADMARKMGSLYFASSEPIEKRKLMAAVRFLFGITYAMNYAKRNFFAQFDKVAQLGNKLEPHLYIRSNENRSDLQTHFTSLYVKSKAEHSRAQAEWGGKREWISRFWPLISVVMTPVITTIVTHNIPNSFSLVLGIVTGIGMAIGISWWYIYSSYKDVFYNTQMKEYMRHKTGTAQTAHAAGVEVDGDMRNTLIRKAWNSARAAFAQEIDMKAEPSADVIFVLTGDEPNHKAQVESLFKRGGDLCGYVRPDVPVFFVENTRAGSGNNMLQLEKYMRSEEFKQEKDTYERLTHIPVDRLRSVVLLAGGHDVFNHQLPGFPNGLNNRPIGVMELTIMNAYQGTQALRRHKRRGQVLLFADGLYLGDMEPNGDFTFLTAWMSRQQLLDQRFGLLLTDIREDNKVWKCYEKIEENKIKNKLEQAALRAYYASDNSQKAQYLGFVGLIISIEDDELNRGYAEIMKNTQDYIERHPLPFDVQITTDMLVPLVTISNGENLKTYLGAVRDDWYSEEQHSFYRGLYKAYILAHDKMSRWFTVRAHIPLSGAARYVRLSDDSHVGKKMLKELGVILAEEPPVTAARADGGTRMIPTREAPGGIDFRSLTLDKTPNGGRPGAAVPEVIRLEQFDHDVGFRHLKVLFRCAAIPTIDTVRVYREYLSRHEAGRLYAKMSYCISEILRLEEQKAVVATDPELISFLRDVETLN